MRDLAIQTADAFILVYAVDDQESLDEICRLKEHILKLRGPNIPPLVVVANKIGLYILFCFFFGFSIELNL